MIGEFLREVPHAVDELRVPVPVPAVAVATKIGGQSGQIGGPRPVRVVPPEGVGHLLERGEAGLHPVGHEADDPLCPRLLHLRHDVDQNDGPGDAG